MLTLEHRSPTATKQFQFRAVPTAWVRGAVIGYLIKFDTAVRQTVCVQV